MKLSSFFTVTKGLLVSPYIEGEVGASMSSAHSEIPLSADVVMSDKEQVPYFLRPIGSDSEKVQAKLDSLIQNKIWWGDIIDKQTFSNGLDYVEHWPQSVEVPLDGRVSGDPLPFNVATDDYIGSVLLFVLAVAAFLLARSGHYLVVKSQQFLSSRRRENLFNDTSEARMQGKYFFSFVLCLALGVLMYDYQQVRFPSVVRQVSPYLMIGVNIAVFGVAYWSRTFLYALVNSVFFDRESISKWMDDYHLLAVFSTMLFMPLALLVVFDEVEFSKWKILFLFSVLIVEIFLIFKTYRIFFEGSLGILHLILYLCTLEILPLLTLWKGMVWVTQELTKLV